MEEYGALLVQGEEQAAGGLIRDDLIHFIEENNEDSREILIRCGKEESVHCSVSYSYFYCCSYFSYFYYCSYSLCPRKATAGQLDQCDEQRLQIFTMTK